VGRGWALEIERFLGPVKWHRADRRVPFGAHLVDCSGWVWRTFLMLEINMQGAAWLIRVQRGLEGCSA
jgi:hypothetical protein